MSNSALNRLSIQTRLLIVILIPLGLMLCIGLLSWWQQKDTNDTLNRISNYHLQMTLLSLGMKYDVAQVQQWYTDISATRGQDGLDDGFSEAAAFAKTFREKLSQAESVMAENGDPRSTWFNELKEAFSQYDAMGAEMARAYVKQGPVGGNKLMGQFDGKAAKMADLMTPFVEEAVTEIRDNSSGLLATLGTQTMLVVSVVGLCLIISLIMGWLMVKSILGQLGYDLSDLFRLLQDMERGSLVGDLPEAKPDTVAGRLIHVRDVLKNNVQLVGLQSKTVQSLVSEQLEVNEILLADSRSSSELSKAVLKENDQLDTQTQYLKNHIDTVKERVDSVTQSFVTLSNEIARIHDSVEGASQNVSRMDSASREMISELNCVSDNLNQVRQSVDVVVPSVAEVESSVQEIRTRCQLADTISLEAKDSVEKTLSIMKSLRRSSEEIDSVVGMINNIAEQTNMLALNASIEAAGAGEAGKGFAVVANEVKDLAQQTSKATQLIEEKIQDIQTRSTDAAAATDSITQMIGRISDTNQEITQAVDEQSMAVTEISRSVESVSSAADEVHQNAAQLTQAANAVAEASKDAANSAEEINQATRELTALSQEVSTQSNDAKHRADSLQMGVEEIYTASVRVQKMMLESLDLTHFLEGTIERSNALAKISKETSVSLKEAGEGLDIGPELFDIEAVKRGHLSWLGRIIEALNGRNRMEGAEVDDSRQCVLGQWYYSEGQRQFGSNPQFVELGRVHEQVHSAAQEVLSLLKEESRDEARQATERLHILREELFKQLNDLYLVGR
ncbi:MAG: CZB domain-containing protein [Magnetococcales bacterium]|nr:CZB domain-containing protein [Magnetococcales bacterium]